ncbi:hypothetical protein Pelo_4518 [Pelomyxa schiedti]|nr:hypothetical protein Pelo_4518 [Pelomyxa schiedti]
MRMGVAVVVAVGAMALMHANGIMGDGSGQWQTYEFYYDEGCNEIAAVYAFHVGQCNGSFTCKDNQTRKCLENPPDPLVGLMNEIYSGDNCSAPLKWTGWYPLGCNAYHRGFLSCNNTHATVTCTSECNYTNCADHTMPLEVCEISRSATTVIRRCVEEAELSLSAIIGLSFAAIAAVLCVAFIVGLAHICYKKRRGPYTNITSKKPPISMSTL